MNRKAKARRILRERARLAMGDGKLLSSWACWNASTKEGPRSGCCRQKREHPSQRIGKHVRKGSHLYTDDLQSYRVSSLDGSTHEFIDHAEAYAGALFTRTAWRTSGRC